MQLRSPHNIGMRDWSTTKYPGAVVVVKWSAYSDDPSSNPPEAYSF